MKVFNWGMYHFSVLRVLLYPAWRIKKVNEKRVLSKGLYMPYDGIHV